MTSRPFPEYVAKFLTNDFAGLLRRAGKDYSSCPIPAEVIGTILRLEYDGFITRKDVKSALRKLLEFQS